jgi:arylsulfatase A-like enzyme
MSFDSLSRRGFLKSVGLGAATIAIPGCREVKMASLTQMGNRPMPNVLFLLTDDQRFDTIHALGNKDIITPNMDWLVRNGTSFTNAYIMGGTCAAVCVPSRAMILTGRTLFHIEREGEWDYPIIKYEAFPEVFKKAGYNTFVAGKQHNKEAVVARSFTQGGKIFFGGMDDHWRVPFVEFSPEGNYPEKDRIELSKKMKEGPPQKHSSEQISDVAVDFINKHAHQKPFLMYVAYLAPHDPRTMPEEYLKMYDPQKLPLPKNFLPEHPFDNGELDIRDETLAGRPRTPEEIRKHIAAYYAMISHVDAQIGKVLDALRKSGQIDNTIIVFTGDNGLALGRHGLMGKQNLYEHSIKVPLIFSGPGIPKNQTRDAYAYLFDIYSTLCDMTNLPIPDTVEGKSLLPVLKNPRTELRSSMFYAYRDFQRALREGDYKLIEYAVKGHRTTQLFDLRNDPWEMNNLAGSTNYTAKLKELQKLLLQWQEQLDDTGKNF